MSPVLLIVGVVVGILALGAVFFFVGRAVAGGGESEPVAVPTEAPGVLTPIPAPTQPSVEPIPSQSAPAPAPGTPSPIPSQPSSEPIPTTPAPQPAPEPAPEPAPQPGPASGETVDIGAGVTVAVPSGWEAGQLDGGGVVFAGTGGLAGLYLISVDPGVTGTDVASYWIFEVVSEQIAGLEVGQIESLPTEGSPSVISAAKVNYTGTVVTQQGSIPVSGGVFTAVRGDGISLLMDVLAFPNADQSTEDAIKLIAETAFGSF